MPQHPIDVRLDFILGDNRLYRAVSASVWEAEGRRLEEAFLNPPDNAQESEIMPQHPLKACKQPGCAGTTRDADRYCTRHKDRGWRRREETRATRWPYNTGRWRSLRQVIIARDVTCRECDKTGRAEPIYAVDHIVSIADGGAVFDSDNLQGLCQSCHNRKTRGEQCG